jgi:hypothetical protein
LSSLLSLLLCHLIVSFSHHPVLTIYQPPFPLQISGKPVGEVSVPLSALSDAAALEAAVRATPLAQQHLGLAGSQGAQSSQDATPVNVRKVVTVLKRKLVNFVL